MGRCTNVGLMLAHRLRRWPNIKPTLVQCAVFTYWGRPIGDHHDWMFQNDPDLQVHSNGSSI